MAGKKSDELPAGLYRLRIFREKIAFWTLIAKPRPCALSLWRSNPAPPPNRAAPLVDVPRRACAAGLGFVRIPRSDDCGDRLEPILPHVPNIGGFGFRERERIADIAMSAVGGRPDVAQRWS